MGWLEDQLAETLAATQSTGVTRNMIDMAPAVNAMNQQQEAASGLIPIERPKSWLEQAREEEGSLKFGTKMLLGGVTGLLPIMYPEMLDRTSYKSQLALYNDQQKLLNNQAMSQPFFDQISNDSPDDDLAALRKLAMLQPDVYGEVLKKYEQNRLVPEDDQYTEGEYQFDPARGEWYLEQQSNFGGIQKTYMGPDFMPRSRMPSADYIDKAIGTSDAENFRANAVVQETGAIISRMDEIGEDNWLAGVAGKGSEFIKNVMGTEDFVTAVRKQYSDIKVRSAINNLPPGVASDRDIQLVLEPWPEDTSNWKLIRDKLEAIQRIEQGRAEYAQFESNWLASKGSRSGLQKAWLQTQRGSRISSENASSKRTWTVVEEAKQ